MQNTNTTLVCTTRRIIISRETVIEHYLCDSTGAHWVNSSASASTHRTRRMTSKISPITGDNISKAMLWWMGSTSRGLGLSSNIHYERFTMDRMLSAATAVVGALAMDVSFHLIAVTRDQTGVALMFSDITKLASSSILQGKYKHLVYVLPKLRDFHG